MAIVEEVKARFIAELRGMKNAFRELRDESAKLGPATKKATKEASGSYEAVFKSADKLKKKLEDAGAEDAFDGLNKALDEAQAELKETGTVSESTMKKLRDSVQASKGSFDDLGDAAKKEFADVESAVDELDRELRNLGDVTGLDGAARDADKAAGRMDEAADAAGDLDRELKDLGDETGLDGAAKDADKMTGRMDHAADAADDLDRELRDLGDTGMDEAAKDADKLGKEVDGVGDEAKQTGKEVDGVGKEFKGMAKDAEKQTTVAGDAIEKMGKTAKRIGGTLATLFAIDKVKDFGINVVQVNADWEAMRDQYEQVMGDMVDDTDKYLDKVAEKWNKHPNELQNAYMQYVALLKGKGVAEEDAHEIAKTTLERTVDANAFANESMEETTGRFMAGIKGEYDSLDTAMVNLTQTMLNDKAVEEYGKKWDELTVTQQEQLKVQEAVRQHTSAGVVGQGAREADSFNNNLAMLKNTWNEFLDDYGGPLLTAANNGLKKSIGFVRGLGDYIEAGRQRIQPFIDGFDTLKEVVGGLLKDDGQKGRDILARIGFSEPLIQRIDGWAAKFAEFRWNVSDFVDGIRGLFKDDGQKGRDILARLGFPPGLISMMDDMAANIAAFKNNVTGSFKAILAFVGGDSKGGRDIMRDLGFTDGAINTVESVIGAFRRFGDIVQYIWPIVSKALGAVAGFVVSTFLKIFDFWRKEGGQFAEAVGNVFRGVLAVIKFVMPLVLGIIKSVWGNIQGVINGALNIIMGAVKIFSGLFTGDFKKMWEGVKQLFAGAVQFVWNYIQLMFFGKIIGGAAKFAKQFARGFSSMWAGVKALFTGGISSAFTSIKMGWSRILVTTRQIFTSVWNFLKSTWTTIWNFGRSTVTNIVNFFRGGWRNLLNNTITTFRNIKNGILSRFREIRDGVVNYAANLGRRVMTTWNTLKANTTAAFRSIWQGIKNRFTDIVNLAKGLPKRIGDGIGMMASKVGAGITKVANRLIRGIGTGVNGVIGGINWVLKKIGSDSRLKTWTVPQYARGTGGHPGGLAVVGDGRGSYRGNELIQEPDGKTYLSPDTDTLVNLPKGTAVYNAKQTKDILANAVPHYGLGNMWNQAKEWGSKAWGKAKDVALNVFDYVKNPGKLLNVALDALGYSKPSGTDMVATVAKGAWDKAKGYAVDYVKGMLNKFDLSGGYGFGGRFRKTSSYGMRFHPIHRTFRMHYGDDYGASVGTPIPAQAGGVVTFSGYHPIRGNYVRIKSGNMERIYQHNSRNAVYGGQTVKKGQIVGYVGSTGSSTGPHLHYEVMKNGRYINPKGYADGGIVDTKQLAWIAEGGWSESVISHDPAKRASQQAIWKQTGEELGFIGDNDAAIGLLRRIANAVERGQDLAVVMNEREVGRILEPIVTQYQKHNESRRAKFKG